MYFKVFDKKYNSYDEEVLVDCKGNVYDRPLLTYDTPHIEVEKQEEGRYIIEIEDTIPTNKEKICNDICDSLKNNFECLEGKEDTLMLIIMKALTEKQ